MEYVLDMSGRVTLGEGSVVLPRYNPATSWQGQQEDPPQPGRRDLYSDSRHQRVELVSAVYGCRRKAGDLNAAQPEQEGP